MAMTEQLRGDAMTDHFRRARFARLASYLAVVAIGLLIGAFLGLVGAFCFGLIDLTC